jgi:hypothetical protein
MQLEPGSDLVEEARAALGVGKIRRVPLREVWRHEALGFTSWMETNFDVLDEALDFPLKNVVREQAAGSFSVDLIAEDDTGGRVILTLIVGPSEETREAGETKRELNEGHQLRQRFWTQLLERARAVTKLHAAVSPGHDTWVAAGAGKTGLVFTYTASQHGAGVELYIDRGKDLGHENIAIFDRLEASRQDIEGVFGEELEWQRLNGKRACRVRKRLSVGGYRDDQSQWPAVHVAMLDAMARLERALKPRIDQLS